MSRLHGPVIVAVLGEALKKFGRMDEHNREQVTRFVRRRVLELSGGEPAEVVEFGAKAAASGERE